MLEFSKIIILIGLIGLSQNSKAQSILPKDSIPLKLEVFPNPSPTQIFSVVINSRQATPVQVKVLDAFQRVIYQKEIRPVYGFSLHTLNLSDRPKGWYYLVMMTKTHKIIKRLECL